MTVMRRLPSARVVCCSCRGRIAPCGYVSRDPSPVPDPPLHIATDCGYAHERYARSLAEFGTPQPLPESGGWVLVRDVQGSSQVDAMNPYPLFVCNDWDALGADLRACADEWVSLTCVVDPFGPSLEALERQGLDFARPLKPHWLVDLSVPYEEAASKHHRYYARYAERQGVDVSRIDDPRDKLDTWTNLYAHLADRHDITGVQAFSRTAFERQFEVPGLVMFLAEHDGAPAGAHLWYEMGDVAYSHLAASNEMGYETSASYALHRTALQYFRDRVRWLNLGGGVGTHEGGGELSGLDRFKKGWATDRQPSLLCGAVTDAAAYDALTAAADAEDTDYFPAYRRGEMT